MKRFGSRRKNFNIPSPKSQSTKKEPFPKARCPVLDSNALPHTNRLARSPCFAEIFEEYEAESDALEDDDRCQRPTPVTLRKKTRSTPSVSHPTHVLVRQSSPPPQLQAPIVATSQVDIDGSSLKSNKKRISRRQSDLISVTNAVGTGHSSSGSTSSSTKSRVTSPPPRASAPHSDRRCGAMPDLRRGIRVCGGSWTPASRWRRGYRFRARFR